LLLRDLLVVVMALDDKIGDKLAPYNPTHLDCVSKALTLLEVDSGDVFYDLGCGDGRLVVFAVENYGCRGIGVEYDGKLVARGRDGIAAMGAHRELASIVHDDVQNVVFDDATKIFVYLVPAGMKALAPRLTEFLRQGGRCVTYVFSIPGLTPISTDLYKGSTKIYLYTAASVPGYTSPAVVDADAGASGAVARCSVAVVVAPLLLALLNRLLSP
jgi:cyclopropane fatty-acyl-phospholipid synthase-like methyltransferase